ncbi:hypothetical protein A5821_000151 [Enterococcus sp. 7F3_DIV0205]|uniref:Membrane protein 6-pyruvoyl-tetrahydropterin synthase-related domain-containing protein n=1 Tax=Candidatus Enterococcus palustris TaxID=1834189 RepID=A0AAQ3WAZ3_9ENTE|nr:hypothetical protein [Enterococcus sp. 7F3_DIV0205]OTN84557.1 hypothetical protein A5821_000485 [Enterococcus sp. 7F3_DIV0205]
MKRKKNLIYNEYVLVCLFALVIAGLFIMPFVSRGYLVYGDDLHYQLSRIKEITGWLQDGSMNFPGISTRSFYLIGYGVNLFYPWLTLTLFSSVSLLIKNPVIAIYIGFYLYTFFTALIAYCCMKRFSHSWVSSAAFSVLYTFSIYRTIDGFTRFALAEFIALTFLPLVLLGSYEVLFGDKRYWVFVTIGFSLIVYTHVLSAFLACLYLFLFWGSSLFFMKERVKRTLILFFSGLVAVFASAGYLFGFGEEQLFQSFLQPSPMNLVADDISELVLRSFSNDLMQSSLGGVYNIGFICLLILFIGVFFVKKMTRNYQLIYGISIATFLLTTSLFPWQLLQQTPLSVIQFPFRLMIFPTLFACLTGANIIKIVSEKLSVKRKLALLAGTILLCLTPWLLSVNKMLDNASRFGFDTESIFFTDPENRYSMWIDQYVPEKSQLYLEDIYQHIGYVDNKVLKMEPIGEKQRIVFELSTDKSRTEVDLPIIRYKNSAVLVNGKKTDITSSERGTIQFIVPKGANQIEVRYIGSKIIIFGVVLSILSWLGLLGYMVNVLKNK